MKIYLNILGIIYLLTITGCVTMELKPGMKIADVNSEFWVFCNKGNFNGDHILYRGDFEYDPSIKIYTMNTSTRRHNDEYAQCSKILYFKNGSLVPDLIIKDLREKGEKDKRELLAKIEIKKVEMKDFINNNRLQIIEKFKNKDESNFRIYINPEKQFYYSINYEFVDGKLVLNEIAKHEQEEKEEIAKHEQEKKEEIARKQALQEYEKQQKIINEKLKIEENKRIKEQQIREQMRKL